MKPISNNPEEFVALAASAAAAPSGREILGTCLALAKLLIEKNTAYGNSALDPVRIVKGGGYSGPTWRVVVKRSSGHAPLDEQLRVRIDDKLSRLQRGSAVGEDAVVDLAGYLILLLIARNMNP